MKKHKEYIILIFIIITLSIILVFDKQNKINYTLPKLPKISKNNIDKIIIKKGNNKEIILSKHENIWLVNNDYKADLKKIDFILNDIENLKLLSLISKGNDYYRYSLDDKNKIFVSIFENNKKVFSFCIGKLASNYSSTYIKLGQKKEIYLAQGNLRLTFDTDIDDLRNKKIITFNTDDINKININIEDKKIIIYKKGKNWKLGTKTLKSKDVIDLLEKLNTTEVESFLKKQVKIKSNPFFEITLNSNNKNYFIKIIKKKEEKNIKYIGISSDLKDQFFMDKYIVKDIINTCKKLSNLSK